MSTQSPPPAGGGDPDRPLVDWRRAGRRLRRSALVLFPGAVVAWLVVGLLTGGPRLDQLGNWVGLAVAGMFVSELVVAGGSALRGMFRAGEEGERLAGGDVSLLPPQLTRRD